MSKIFLDTNILVYSIDYSNTKKQEICNNLLTNYIDSSKDKFVISTQVIQEFYVNAIKKLKISQLDAKSIINDFNEFEITNITTETINEAINCSIINQVSFWDSLIITAAKTANCNELWTEDLNNNQIIQGIKIVNPFQKLS